MAKFDVDADLVRKLAGLLAESDLSEIEYALGEQRIRVARGRAVESAPAAAPVARFDADASGQRRNRRRCAASRTR